MKYEWRKEEKDLYLPKLNPVLIKVPKMKFFSIKGKGNPNNKDFQERIQALYTLSYAIRMMPKNGYNPEGYYEYTVYPLEGIWDLSEKGRKKDYLDKDELVYTIMIRQPEFVNKELSEKAFEIVRKKKDIPLIDEVKFEETSEELCVQVMHIGSYDDEPKSFALIDQFLLDNNYERTTLIHKEIYLSDFRKVAQDKLKTVLRCSIIKKD